MNRARRLQSAKHWIPTYSVKSIIRGYRKHYGVDWRCAVKELEWLGVPLDQVHVERLKRTVEGQSRAKQRAKLEKKNRELQELWEDSDETFAYVAGYTSGGVPFGITWVEIGEKSPGLDSEEDWELPF
jgi:hypothetical protein